jgi:hypothetical protein
VYFFRRLGTVFVIAVVLRIQTFFETKHRIKVFSYLSIPFLGEGIQENRPFFDVSLQKYYWGWIQENLIYYAPVAELVDVVDLGSTA